MTVIEYLMIKQNNKSQGGLWNILLYDVIGDGLINEIVYFLNFELQAESE